MIDSGFDNEMDIRDATATSGDRYGLTRFYLVAEREEQQLVINFARDIDYAVIIKTLTHAKDVWVIRIRCHTVRDQGPKFERLTVLRLLALISLNRDHRSSL